MADAVRPTRWLLPTVLPIIRIMLTTFLREDQPTEEFNSPKYLYDRYDFIIVGGGTAGCVLASRLSEVAHWKILVLEAGGPPPPESRVPGLSRLFYFPSATTWHYNLAPQRHGLRAYNNRSSPVPHGRVIGGSSTVNGMVYARGSPRDFDHWASLGNPGWDYLSVLPYFKKSERYRGPKRPHTERFHGRRGPIPVTPESPGFFTRVFLQAGRYLGFKLIDPNGPDLMGFAGPDYTIYRGERWGPVRAYLEPAAKRPNLHILHSAHVLRIIFNKDKVAVGVIFMHHDKVKAVKANLEVILSAGAIASPKVLMLSGVGPQKHLHHHGIKVVHDLPGVGKNLQEHMCLYGLTWTVKPGVPNDVLNAANPASVTQYVHQKSGPFATPLGDFGNAWVSFNESEPNWPDIQLLMVSSGLPQEGILAAVAIGLDQRKYHQYFAGLAGRQTMTMMPYLARPKSRGAIYLRSKRPLDRQVIDPKYLSHPDDIAAFLKGIGLAMNISRTSPFVKNLGTRFHARPLDDCKDRALGSREYWVCYIRHMASTFYHFAGSCKMGPATDPKSVVDEELKVRGVYGVRVIDASVMPTVVSANLMASTIMIAEKAADKIKEKLANQARSADYVLYNWLDSQSVDDLFEENLAELQVEVSQFVQEYPTENYSR